MFIKMFKYYYFIFGIHITNKNSFVESLDTIGYDNQSSPDSMVAFYTESALKVSRINRANTQDSAIEEFNNINGTVRKNENFSSNRNSIADYRSMFLEYDNNTTVGYNNNLDIQRTKKVFPLATITLEPEKSLKGIVNYQNKSGVIGSEKMNSMLNNNKKIKLAVNLTSTHQSIDTTWKKHLADPPTVLSLLVAPSAHGKRKDVTNSIINSSVSNNHFKEGEIAVRIMDDDDFDSFYGMMICKKWITLPHNIRRKLAHKINHIIDEAMAGKVIYDRVDDDCTVNDRGGNGHDINNDCTKSKRRVKRGKHCCKKRKSANCKSSGDTNNTFSGRRFANLNLDLKPIFSRSMSTFITDITTTVSTTTTPLISTTIDVITQSIATSTKKKINSKRIKCSKKRKILK